ncbi:family 20 glycosylhydrolase [Flammeovirgaceae bacterium SG7u.111]|nr:family 20 glycosylhydrolase [Flammeovirgaceae bacterium SG7u.132]WPO38538.1 family 20 glycosylhydrolase [Flammeovirgaceae bacterium SG7u.111]
MKMKRMYQLLWAMGLFLLSLTSCKNENMEKVTINEVDGLAVTWELIGNMTGGGKEDSYSCAFTLFNNTSKTLASDWTMYFNDLPRKFFQDSTAALQVQHINGDFFKLSPSSTFTDLQPGDSIRVEMKGQFWAIKESDAPCGLYFVFEIGEGKESKPSAVVANFTVKPFDRPEQYTRSTSDKYPHPDANYLFAQYKDLEKLPLKQKDIIPNVKKTKNSEGQFEITTETIILFERELESESEFLAEKVKETIGLTLEALQESSSELNSISLSINSSLSEEGYELKVSPSGVSIEGGSAAGVFYGIQTLVAMLPIEGKAPLESVELNDFPDLKYRGLHLDVSRNFHSKESILKLLDLMASYKLNKFHFHLTDDEGWRLEIPGLPELTEVGAFRGHTQDELENLYPSYGSGPSTENTVGSGFYSKEEFIEILNFAKVRHIEVIPEIDLPGHARAAIVAMNVRYKKLMAEGKQAEAEEFLLHDPQDKSVYASVQNYTDNVVCVCQPSLYTFLEKVVAEIDEMYDAADLELKTLHTGGDEVPKGVWTASPICEDLKKENTDLKTPHDLGSYFLENFHQILHTRGITTAGWEEIAMKDHTTPNPEFANSNFLPFVWNTVTGWGGEQTPYKLANEGYKVVLCNAPNLYFDMAYSKHSQEPGYYWAGFVGEKEVFDLRPFDIYESLEMGMNGEKLSPSEDQTKLEKKENIIGVQGQLWSETVKGQDMLEYYIFPKLLSLAERAWNAEPTWMKSGKPGAYKTAWNSFKNVVGQKELPRLGKQDVAYRVPPPGAKVIEGKLAINTLYPNLVVRYTTDGSEPNADSPLASESLTPNSNIKLRAFDQLGRGSRTVVME